MPYVATVPVLFPFPREKVFEALCDSELFPLWHSGLKKISTTERLRVGLRFVTESTVTGRTTTANVEVTRMIPREEIEMVNDSGLVAYQALIRVNERGPDACEVVTTLRFELRNFVLDIARPVIEAMAQARLKGDLETLRALLSDG
jgi:hypothetical protein